MKQSSSFTVNYTGRVNALVVDVGLTDVYDPKSGGAQPAPMKFRSIWDTGATNSVISKSVIQGLGLKPIGKSQTMTANGPRLADVYLVNFYLPNGVAFSAVRVTDGDLAGTDVLIGMDIIGVGDFSVTHEDGKTCMSFRLPSCRKIDYVAESRAYKRVLPQPPDRVLSPEEAKAARDKHRDRRKRRGY